MRDFADNLDRVNALAEAAEGFVWRLQDDTGNATSIQHFEDPLLLVNMSVWTSVEALKDFMYRTVHVDFLRRRQEWFEKSAGVMTVLWWVSEGHIPGIPEAVERLERLRSQGTGPDAFTLRDSLPASAIE